MIFHHFNRVSEKKKKASIGKGINANKNDKYIEISDDSDDAPILKTAKKPSKGKIKEEPELEMLDWQPSDDQPTTSSKCTKVN